MATLDDLRGLGYDVGLSFEGDGFSAYRVEGLSLATMVRDDDPDTIQGLVDSHDERVKQSEETRAETILRHATDPDSPTELDDDHRRSLEEQARQERRALEDAQTPAG